MDRHREISSSPESCNDHSFSATPSNEMTSVRTCYCKQEENVPRKKDNNCGLQKNGNQYPTTVVPRISMVRNENSGESSRRGGLLTDERMSNISRSVEVQPSHPALSPETSIALENAEKIINNAKMQLVEVCAMSNCLNSSRSTRKIYTDDPPLDDEAEELLYIRGLVAAKFQEASSLKLDANQADSARSELAPVRVGAHQVDLSASKFRTSRRHADWKSNLLGYGDDDRSRASLLEASSRNDCSTKEPIKEEEDYRQRTLPATGCIRARETACGIQMGPSVDIVGDRRLTKQNLEDVHISPYLFLPENRMNTATYTLRHDVNEKSTDRKANEAEVLKFSSVELDCSRRKERERPTSAELAAEAATKSPLIKLAKKSVEDVTQVGDFNSEQIESHGDCGKKKKNRDLGSQTDKDDEITTNREATVSGASKKTDISSEEPKTRPRNEKQVVAGDDINNRRRAEMFGESDERDKRIQQENRRSLLESNTSGKARVFRHEDIAPRCQATKSRGTIDEERLDNTFDSHYGRKEEPIPNEDTRRQSPVSDCQHERDDDSCDLVALYRPRLDDLNAVLLSNNKKLRHVARATKTLAELLSRTEFAEFKVEAGRHDASYRKCCREPDEDSVPPSNRAASFSEIGPTVVPNTSRLDANNDVHNAHTEKNTYYIQRTKSTDGLASNDVCTNNSLESSVYPESDRSEALRMLRRNNEIRRKGILSSESDRSDIATFSNLDPALSSTCRHGEERIIVRAEQSVDATSANELLSGSGRADRNERSDDAFFARVFQCLRNTSEATDRFVACILQDEKHSVEMKIRSALKESAIVPAPMRKLLNRLCESAVRTTCQTETLNILKSILNDVQDYTDPIGKIGKDDEELSQNILDRAEHCRDSKHFDERSSDRNKRERNTENANILKSMEIDVKNQTYEKNIDQESKSNDKETSFSGNIVSRFVQANAVEESIPQENINVNDSEQTSKRIHDLKNPNKYSHESPEIRAEETTVRSENDTKSKKNSYSETESLRQVSDIHSDDENSRNFPNSKTTSVNDERKSDADDLFTTDRNKEQDKDKSSDVQDNKTSIREDEFTENKNSIQTVTRAIDTDISKDTSVKKATIEKEHSDDVLGQKKISGHEISEASKKQLDLSTRFDSETVDKNPAKKDSSFPSWSAKEDIESVSAKTKNNNNSQQSLIVKQTSECSASSSVRNSVYASSVKGKKLSLKEDPLHDKQTCLIVAGKNNSTENAPPKGDELKDEDDSKLLENTESGDCSGQTDTMQKSHVNQLSTSNSSISSALLDLDGRPKSNDVTNAITKSIESSVETSHSEGELYMPSSCSYSLGEVRILKKSDLITDNVTDRENSAMFLVTRSMLTSLNDSTMSLENSSHT